MLAPAKVNLFLHVGPAKSNGRHDLDSLIMFAGPEASDRLEARKAEEHMKGMVSPGTLFEELGFNYVGPVDGHDVIELVHTLRNLKTFNGPQFLHVATQKGKGFTPA